LPKLTAASKPLGDSKMCTEVLTNEQRQRVFAVFDKIDTDGGGTIDLEELAAVHSQSHAERLFVVIDSSNTGEISREDWFRWFEDLAETSGAVVEFQLRYMERNAEANAGSPSANEASDGSDIDEDEADATVAGAAAARKASHHSATANLQKMPLAEQVSHLFTVIDVDGGGTIDSEEMAHVYGADSVLLMQRMDVDGDREVSLDQWNKFWLEDLAQENVKVRDHVLETLQNNMAGREARERKQRRMFFRTAQQRRQTGRSARFSSRPLASEEMKEAAASNAAGQPSSPKFKAPAWTARHERVRGDREGRARQHEGAQGASPNVQHSYSVEMEEEPREEGDKRLSSENSIEGRGIRLRESERLVALKAEEMKSEAKLKQSSEVDETERWAEQRHSVTRPSQKVVKPGGRRATLESPQRVESYSMERPKAANGSAGDRARPQNSSMDHPQSPGRATPGEHDNRGSSIPRQHLEVSVP